MVWGVHPPFLTCTELPTTKSVGRLLDIRIALQTHLAKLEHSQLMVPMLRVLVSLMAAIPGGRQHIWTFAAALDEVGATYPGNNCPCTNRNLSSSATPPPDFVGNDYFCDTGSADEFQHIFYGDDPLWDGAGCGPYNDCCDLNNPPWFRKQLPSFTIDNIEMRLCREKLADEDTPVEIIEIYVR